MSNENLYLHFVKSKLRLEAENEDLKAEKKRLTNSLDMMESHMTTFTFQRESTLEEYAQDFRNKRVTIKSKND